MIFKRKKAREVSVGDVCVVDTKVIEKLRSYEGYLRESCAMNMKNNDNHIYSHNFNNFNKKVLFADVELFVVKKNSIFDGILELVPIIYYRDNNNGEVIRHVLNKKITMTCNKKCLSLVSKSQVENLVSSRYSSYENFVISRLQTYHGISFNWMR